MKRYAIMIGLALLALGLMSQIARAQGPVTPPPVTPVPTKNPIDEANSRADQWQQVANQAVASAQASINAAYGALANAQASINQYQIALLQSEAARLAAQQGQINQAVESAHAAQLSGLQAIALASQAGQSAMTAIEQSGMSMRRAAELKTSLTTVTGQRDTAVATAAQYDKDRTALAGALAAERQRSDLFGKVAIAALLLLMVVLAYIAIVLWKLMKALRVKPNDRVVVLDERGRVKAQIEALH